MKLKQNTSLLFLSLCSLFFVILRIPSLFEPNWYGDEGIYQVIGFALRHGRSLYEGAWDNKPPMLYLIYALFDGNQFAVRLAGIITGLISIWLFYYIAKILLKESLIVKLTTVLFAFLFGIPLLEGNIANAENFMIPLSLSAALLFIHYLKQKKNKPSLLPTTFYLLLSGLLLGISFLIKVVAVFDLAAFSIIIFIAQYKNVTSIIREIIRLIPFWISFFIPLAITILYFYTHNALKIFIQSAFLSNVGYVNYANKFIIPQGLLLVKLILLAAFCLSIFFLRKKIAFERLFIYIWMSFSLFAALFSGRPYTHYLLVLISALCLFTGAVFGKKRIDFISTFLYVLLILFLVGNFTFYPKVIPYYQNFLSYATNQKSLSNYYAFFDNATPRDYDIANYLNTQLKPQDTIFIWGNNGQLYRLVDRIPPGRFIVQYHILWDNNMAETKAALDNKQPRFIIVMPDQPQLPYPLLHYQEKIGIDKTIIYERIAENTN